MSRRLMFNRILVAYAWVILEVAWVPFESDYDRNKLQFFSQKIKASQKMMTGKFKNET